MSQLRMCCGRHIPGAPFLAIFLSLALLAPILAAPTLPHQSSQPLPRGLQGDARGRHLSQSGKAHKAASTAQVAADPAPAPADASLPGDTSGAKLGEPCQMGGNIMPISCLPGLVCNATQAKPPGTPGWNPDAAAQGYCVLLAAAGSPGTGGSTIPGAPSVDPTPIGNPSVVTAPEVPTEPKEGENCTVGGSLMAVLCQAGLFCDLTAYAAMAPGSPAGGTPNLDSAQVGVCRQPGDQGALCFAGNGTLLQSTSWTAPCGPGLECYILDPSPVVDVTPQALTGSKVAVSKVSAASASQLLGFCINSASVPPVDSTQPSGSQAGVCKVTAPVGGSTQAACTTGLTCVVPSSSLAQSPSGVTYGVCADATALLAGSKVRGGITNNIPAQTAGSDTSPPLADASTPAAQSNSSSAAPPRGVLPLSMLLGCLAVAALL